MLGRSVSVHCLLWTQLLSNIEHLALFAGSVYSIGEMLFARVPKHTHFVGTS